MNFKEIQIVLSSVAPFTVLAGRKLKRLVQASSPEEYNNNDIIYRQDSHSDCLFVLLKGRVAASTSIDGQSRDIEILKRGTCFGVISFLTNQPHSVGTRSIERSYVLKIPKDFFKEFLTKEPLLALEFSTMLSQRVTVRSKPKKIFQSKKISVTSDRTLQGYDYARNLAMTLAKETRKKSITLFLRPPEDEVRAFNECAAKPLLLSNFQESLLERHIEPGGCDCAVIIFDAPDQFFSLLNFLSESYHFVVYAAACHTVCEFHDIIVVPCDQIHFLADSSQRDLSNAGEAIQNIKSKSPINPQKLKVIVFGKHPGDHISFDKDCRQLAHPIYARISPDDPSSLALALKRIAREIGEMTLGLALGSGAAYGFAHIGVIEALEEAGVEIDVICGSSMGSIIAALWAAGFSQTKIIEVSQQLGRQLGRFAFTGFSLPFRGIMKARRLENIFKEAFGDLTFYDLQHRLKIVAFDFKRRSTVIFDQGPLYKAVAASCAFPGFFEPIGSKTNILLDGGILHPLPTKILLEFAIHKIIASNITLSSEEAQRHYETRKSLHVFDFIFGSIETMQQEFVREASKIADVVVHPRLEGLGWLEFGKIDEFIIRGRRAVQEKIEDIKKLAAD